MMTRREFVQGPIVAGGLAFAAARSAHAQGRTRYSDQLTDSSGKYAVAPLPYYDALEPAIDARTVELHYNHQKQTAWGIVLRARVPTSSTRTGGRNTSTASSASSTGTTSPSATIQRVVKWIKLLRAMFTG